MKKIFFIIISCKQHGDSDKNGDNTFIHDVDLTKKLDSRNTWLMDIINLGHDFMFVDGGGLVDSYNELTQTLTTCGSDKGDNVREPSHCFEKLKKAFRFALDNKQFDMAYVCDDDLFININHFFKTELDGYDLVSNGSFGGSGFFLSHASLEKLCEYDNKEFHNSDTAIFSVIKNSELKSNDSVVGFCPFYIPGENYSSIHYCSGRRMYFLHNLFKFYNNTGITGRKIVFGGPFDASKKNDIVTLETLYGRKTKRSYDYVMDINGWEYHDEYACSTIVHIRTLFSFWPYAPKAAGCFILNVKKIEQCDEFGFSSDELFSKFRSSLINLENLYLCSEDDRQISGWVRDNDLHSKLKLSSELSHCNFYKSV